MMSKKKMKYAMDKMRKKYPRYGLARRKKMAYDMCYSKMKKRK